MSIADIALVACLAMLATAIIDWRRGVTGLGKLRLTKKDDPDRYWMALVLYFNMAFLMFWLFGQAQAERAEEEPAAVTEGPLMMIDIEQATRE
ncbi:hypothetical protein [Aurantiacibacter zhengii]|uniref:Uncharacterized protein n=1 Tax=Aurantiacibacter zhengii TaxID=2307003 RepID=A0A418NRF5_9SPHN|nr:hypothetical protein [Aurantiacibacter zhengii]RIV85714.1 hypothetical protein D2V07_10270 [Aurantiacibacter zhengii]